MSTTASNSLQRRLGLRDAIVIGLGSMIGAGVFAAFSPAARAAGDGLLIGLVVAAVAAFCNAISSATLAGWLAAIHPRFGVPARAEAALAVVVCTMLLVADLRAAVAFSSFVRS